ncbi:MAG TPA: YetF domain-containing protein [Chitinophagaceae bacterium]|nr:YetF domain-containing protein [Chitinophagaceae bacterium]
MYLLQSQGFSWQQLLLGSEEWSFLPETVFRSLIMFSVILTSLSILGKRGVKQLSVFELVVIIGLGSAAGDPMFYKDVGLLPAIIVFIMVTSLYMLVTHLVGKNKKIEHLVEGKAVCLVEEGKFAIQNFEKEPLGQDEFFAELRLRGVSQLGQVEKAIIETNGGISIFFYEDKDVHFGLPIMPDSLLKQTKKISTAAYYACVFCGYTEKLQPASKHACPECKKDQWVQANNKKRVR